jgi:hypothetical protein
MNDTNIEALLKRVERLEAIEEIKELTQRSAIAADPNMDIDIFINNYTEDGIMEIVNWGTVLKGREEIAGFLAINPFTWMFHCLIPLKIIVADDLQSATGRWYLLEAATVLNSKTEKYDPVWVMGAYDNDIVKTSEGWKFTHTRLTQEVLTTYEDGWGGENRVNVNPDWVKPVDDFMASRK